MGRYDIVVSRTHCECTEDTRLVCTATEQQQQQQQGSRGVAVVGRITAVHVRRPRLIPLDAYGLCSASFAPFYAALKAAAPLPPAVAGASSLLLIMGIKADGELGTQMLRVLSSEVERTMGAYDAALYYTPKASSPALVSRSLGRWCRFLQQVGLRRVAGTDVFVAPRSDVPATDLKYTAHTSGAVSFEALPSGELLVNTEVLKDSTITRERRPPAVAAPPAKVARIAPAAAAPAAARQPAARASSAATTTRAPAAAAAAAVPPRITSSRSTSNSSRAAEAAPEEPIDDDFV
eukprot:m51a1_g8214 hypothetical protein (292) ;mRNA; r:74007-75615